MTPRTHSLTPDLLERAVQAADDGVYITDVDGTILFANDAILRISGYPHEEFVGARTSIFHSGEMSAAYYARLWNTVLSGSVWREVIRNRRADGSVYTASQTITPVTDERNEVRLLIAVQRDITRQHELEQELHDRQTEVERLLARQETLLGEVYHRVKNDMQLAESLLSMQSTLVSDPAARDALEQAARRTAALGDLYELMHNRQAVGRIPLGELLTTLLGGLRATTLPPDTNLETRVDDTAVSARTASSVALAVNELVVNAVKYALPDTPDPRITLDARRDAAGFLRLTVTDNGPGLPHEVLRDRAFGMGLRVTEALALQSDGCLILRNRAPEEGGSGAVVGLTLLTDR